VWKFVAGFAVASVLWGALIVSSKQGWIDISLAPETPQDDAPEVAANDEPDEPGKTGRPRRKRAPVAKRTNRSSAPAGDSTTGDDLRETDARNLNVGTSGGEQQLRGTEIEQGFGAA
jgi:hypothetical protein